MGGIRVFGAFKQPVMNDVFNKRFKRFINFKRKRKKSSSISSIRKHFSLFVSKFENACFYGLTEINIFSIENLPKGHLVSVNEVIATKISHVKIIYLKFSYLILIKTPLVFKKSCKKNPSL